MFHNSINNSSNYVKKYEKKKGFSMFLLRLRLEVILFFRKFFQNQNQKN